MTPQPEAYRLLQSGEVVARSEGEHSLREIMHYAVVYSQDGPVSIQRRVKRHWRSYGEMGCA